MRSNVIRRHYHRLLERHFAFLIPRGSSVLDLRCGTGDLLAAVRPMRGLGIDRSSEAVAEARRRHPGLEFHVGTVEQLSSAETFDYIIVSDMVDNLQDVQKLLDQIRAFSGPRTRLMLNTFNNVWRPLFSLAGLMGFHAPTSPRNWLSTADVANLLYLSGWEVLKTDPRVLLRSRYRLWTRYSIACSRLFSASCA